MTLSRGEQTGDVGGVGGDAVHGAGSDGDVNGDSDDDDGSDVVDGAGIMLTMMVQLHLAKASRRV